MLDFGWAELFVIMAVAVLVIGPQEIPGLMLGLGRIVRRIQYVKYAFTQQFEEFMQASDLKNLQDSVNFEARGSAEAHNEDFDEAGSDEELLSSGVDLEYDDEEKEERRHARPSE